MKTRALALSLLLLAPTAFAAGLAKYKDWPSTPVAYFMTKAERARWSAIQSDAEAETFVNDYLTSRGPGFADEVAKRAAMADKYLTVGKTPGSKSLRGKTVIVLGPPLKIGTAKRELKGNASGTAAASLQATGDGGPTVGNMAAAADRSAMMGGAVIDYTFEYSDKVVVLEVNPTTGADRFADRKAAAKFDDLIELAALASIK